MTQYCLGLDYSFLKNNEYAHHFTTKENIYFNMVDEYFKNNIQNYKLMVDIVNGNSKISLRILDWYITKYTKKYKINYLLGRKIFHVHINYKAQLQSFRKQYFDPFRRKQKFTYTVDNVELETTLGQLNFFCWAFQSKIVEQVDTQFNTILNLMNKSNKDNKEKKTVKPNSKDKETPTSTPTGPTTTKLTAKMQVDDASNGDVELLLQFD